MCNPREIRLTETQDLHEAWSHRISETVSVSDLVTRRVTAEHELGATTPPPILAALPGALARIGFHQEEGLWTFYFDDEARVSFDPNTGLMQLVVEASEQLTAQGSASTEITGVTEGQVEVVGDSWYYDDDWGGRTEAVGAQEAQERMRRDFAAKAAQRVEEDQQRAAEARAQEMGRAAEEDARRRLDADAVEAGRRLEEQARRRVSVLGDRVGSMINRATGMATRDVLLQLAQESSATIDVDEDSGDVMRLEFTMPN